jgi:hypothetical protein
MRDVNRGDLVLGHKPWNKFARVGIVLQCSNTKTPRRGNYYRVFWFVGPGEKITTKNSFILEEVKTSFSVILGKNNKVKKDDV